MDKIKSPESRQANAIEASRTHPPILLPPNISEIMKRDPRLIGFIAARHKFVAKIFEGLDILEIGCQEGFGTMFVAPYVSRVTCIDFYAPFIDGFNQYSAQHLRNCVARQANIIHGPILGPFDGAFALDVLEHIEKEDEAQFWLNLCGSLKPNGIAIIGMPSLESQAYASEASRIGHVNCKTGEELKQCAKNFFSHVTILSMNDEMLHNGYLPMSHYILALCSGKLF